MSTRRKLIVSAVRSRTGSLFRPELQKSTDMSGARHSKAMKLKKSRKDPAKKATMTADIRKTMQRMS